MQFVHKFTYKTIKCPGLYTLFQNGVSATTTLWNTLKSDPLISTLYNPEIYFYLSLFLSIYRSIYLCGIYLPTYYLCIYICLFIYLWHALKTNGLTDLRTEWYTASFQSKILCKYKVKTLSPFDLCSMFEASVVHQAEIYKYCFHFTLDLYFYHYY